MLDGGADPRYLARRIVRMGLGRHRSGRPRAIQLCNDAAATYERLGSPEGELALAQPCCISPSRQVERRIRRV